MKKLFILSSLGLLLFFGSAHLTKAAGFFDDFESYSPGDLGGQGNWTGATTAVTVQNTHVIAGTQSVGFGGSNGAHSNRAVSFTGTVPFSFKMMEINGTNNGNEAILFFSGSDTNLEILIEMNGAGGYEYLDGNAACGSYQSIGTSNGQNVPDTISGSIDETAHTYHFSVNGGTDSGSIPFCSGGTIDTVGLYSGNNSNGVLDDLSIDQTTPSSNPTIEFYFPVNMTTTGIFSNWIVSTTNIVALSGQPYIFGVGWNSSGTAPDLDNAQDGIIQQNSNVLQFIPSSAPGYTNQTTSYEAQAFIAVSGQGIIATSSIINFDIGGNLPPVVNNTAHQIQPESTSSAFCIAPANQVTDIGTDLSFALCSVAGTFFGANVPSYGFMAQQWAAFQNVAPFNLVFGVASSVQNSISGATTSSQEVDVTIPIGFINSTIPVLSSSTLTQLFVTAGNGHNIPACDLTCAQGKKDTFLGYESNVIYAGTGILTIAMIL